MVHLPCELFLYIQGNNLLSMGIFSFSRLLLMFDVTLLCFFKQDVNSILKIPLKSFFLLKRVPASPSCLEVPPKATGSIFLERTLPVHITTPFYTF